MMWPYYAGGVHWVWMGLLMVLFWGGLVLLVAWAIRAFSGPASGRDDALDVLRRRLAAGEISPEDYEKTKRALQG